MRSDSLRELDTLIETLFSVSVKTDIYIEITENARGGMQPVFRFSFPAGRNERLPGFLNMYFDQYIRRIHERDWTILRDYASIEDSTMEVLKNIFVMEAVSCLDSCTQELLDEWQAGVKSL